MKNHSKKLICDISHKTVIDPKLLHIKFDNIDRFIGVILELHI